MTTTLTIRRTTNDRRDPAAAEGTSPAEDCRNPRRGAHARGEGGQIVSGPRRAPPAGAMARATGERARVAHRASAAARAVDAGILSFQEAARHLTEADARFRRTRLRGEGGEPRLRRPDRRGQDGTRLG